MRETRRDPVVVKEHPHLTTDRRIRLHALRQSTVGHTAAGLWRHPDSRAHEYRELAHWIETARILERGRFDALFIADALGPLEVYQGRVDAALRDGIRRRPTMRCW